MLQNTPALSRRSFALGAAALAGMGLAVPALASESAKAGSAQADAITGASTVIDAEGQLTQEGIRGVILDYLRGWPLTTDSSGSTVYSYREMYAIATCYDNHPCISQVEFVLDPATMRLLGSCEKGTEKCEQVRRNPEVQLYWYHQIPEADYVPGANDYFNSYGVQFKGTAKVLTLDDEGAAEFASQYMATLRGAEAWGATPEENKQQTLAMLFEVNDWIEVTPAEIIVNSLNWRYNTEDSKRPDWYDPEAVGYGKAVRQVYTVPQA